MEQRMLADLVDSLPSLFGSRVYHTLITAVFFVLSIALVLLCCALQRVNSRIRLADRHIRLVDLSGCLHQHADETTTNDVILLSYVPGRRVNDDGSTITAGMDAPNDQVLHELWKSIRRIPQLSADGAETNRTVHTYWDRLFGALQRLYDNTEQPLERRKSMFHDKTIFQSLARPDWVITPSWHVAPSAFSAEIVVVCKRHGQRPAADKQAKRLLARRCLARVHDLEVATSISDDAATKWRFVAVCVEHMSASFLMLRIRQHSSTKALSLVWQQTDWFDFASASKEPPPGMRVLCTLLYATHEQLGYQVVRRSVVMGGKYRVYNVLGSGGFCDVYEVVGGVEGVPTAAKVIRHADAARESIACEAQALRALHPCQNIPTLVDSDKTCLILQPVGKPLLLVLDELYAAFPEWDFKATVQPEALRRQRTLLALDVARDVSAALRHAHARGYAHKDVRTANILCADQHGRRRFVLADWGVSQACTPELARKDARQLFCVVALIAGPTDGIKQSTVYHWFLDAWNHRVDADSARLELFARLPAAAAAYDACVRRSSRDLPAQTHACLSWLASASMNAAATVGDTPVVAPSAGVSSMRSRFRRRRGNGAVP